jgi:Tol biopolymer transport system component
MRSWIWIGMLVVLALGMIAMGSAAPMAGQIDLRLVTADGDGRATHGTIMGMSAEGRYLLVRDFYSAFVIRDMETGTSQPIPIPNPNYDGSSIFLAGNGGRITINFFENNIRRLYWVELSNNTYTQVRANNGQLPNADIQNLGISEDGQYLLYTSPATNLVAGDTNLVADLFLYNTETAQSEIVSRAQDGSQLNTSTTEGSLSADGRYLVFASTSSTVVAGDTNNVQDIFRRDLTTGEVRRVSLRTGGVQLYTPSHKAVVSRDGRYVAFITDATDCELPAAPQPPVLCLHDTQTGETRRISRRADRSDPTHPGLGSVQIAADGGYVLFDVSAGLSATDTNTHQDIYRYTIETGEVERLSVGQDGREANGSSYQGLISTDGSIVAFNSVASNLLAGDTDTLQDGYWRTVIEPPPTTPTPTATRMPNTLFLPMSAMDRPVGTYPFLGVMESTAASVAFPSISGNGQLVIFSTPIQLLPGDTDDWFDIYAWHRDTNTIEQISVESDGSEGIAVGVKGVATTDGRYVIMVIGGALEPTDTNNGNDIYRHDRVTGVTERISQYDTEARYYGSRNATTSSDGNRIAYNLSIGANSYVDVQTIDTGTVLRMGDETGQPLSGAMSPSLSEDGESIAFLVSTDSTGNCTNADIYLGSTRTGRSEKVVTSEPGTSLHSVMLSGDGQTLGYFATNGDRTSLLLRHADGTTETLFTDWFGYSYSCAYDHAFTLSEDARWVAFRTIFVPDMPEDTNAVPDVYLYDRRHDFLRRVSVTDGIEGQTQANGASASPAISADGRTVIFLSQAGNLPDGGEAPPMDGYRLFVWGR